jgi:hypothetical protein
MRTALAIVCCLATWNNPRGRCAEPAGPEPSFRPAGFRLVRTIETEDDFAHTFTFSPDSKALVIADGQSVRFVNPRTGKEAAAPWKFTGAVRFLAFVDARTLALVAEPCTTVSIRAYPSGKELAGVDFGKNQLVSALAATKGVIAVATGAPAHRVRVLTAPEWREAWHDELPENDWPITLVLSPNGSELVASRGSKMRVFAVKDGKLLHSAGRDKFVSANLTGLGISPDGRQIAFGPTAPDGAGILVL